MESLNRIIRACLIIIIGVCTHADINCPNIYIARGGSRVIHCLSNRTIKDFYWYRGTTSTSRPILGLQDGQKGGTEYRGEHFDIFENGSMAIENVKFEHESYYTFVGYYNQSDFDSATFLVTVTITPDPMCPVITGCRPCEDCTIDAPKKSDTLTCRVTGARPLIPLRWNITSQSGISFVQYQYEGTEQQNEDMDSWDTYLSLDYELTEPCGVIAEVQCIAEDIAELLSSNKVTLHITNELCYDATPTTDATPADFGSVRLLLLIIALLVIAISIFLTGCCIYYRRKKKGRAKSIIVAHHKDDGATGETDIPLLPNQGKPSKVKRESLVKALALFYEKFCSLKPLPWGEPIPISALYSDFRCVVTAVQTAEYTFEESQDLGKITCSEELFASSRFKNASRVIFIADLGYGKTTMTQQVVQQWIQKDTKNFILIYIQLKEVDIDKSISAVVKDMLPSSMDASVDAIEKVLKENKVLVLLDGLDELSVSVEKDVGEENEINDGSRMAKSNNGTSPLESLPNNLIVGDLLKGKVRSLNTQMRVWVTSREVDDMKSPFPPPYVKIKMTGFSSEQVDNYIRKTCQYYCHSVNASNPESTAVMIEDVVKKVKENIDKDDIIQEFVNTPLLLVLIIHILTAKFTGAVAYLQDMKLTKLTSLIRTVITCLESRYVQKIQDPSLNSKIYEIERQLGDIAWKQKLEIEGFDREGWDKLLGTEYVNIALSIGLLRLSKQISNSNVRMRQLAFSSFTGVKFYHQYFLEYLAGQYFSTEQQTLKQLEKSLEKISDDKTIRFLQFMSGCGHPFVTKVSKIFLKDQKKWNNFVDFIYETEDQNKVKSYLEIISKKAENLGVNPVVNFAYLDKKHHQDAVSAFCELCNKFNITIRAFIFRQDCPLTYLTQLVLPQLKRRLEVLEMSFDEDDFVSILQWISRQKLPQTFQFTKCKFDHTLSPESKQKIKTAMEGKKLKIYSSESSSQIEVYVDSFNVKKGEWTKELFPKKQ